MPVVCNNSTTEQSEKMVCESNLSGAIRESLQQPSSSSGNNFNGNDDVNIQDRMVAYAKRIFMTNLEYEEAPSSSTVIYENLKSKYTVLKANPGGASTQNGSHEIHRNGIASQLIQSPQGKGPSLPHPKRVLFPISAVHIGWKSLGHRWTVGSGMINMGNTCYLNSTLQALFHVPSMASWLVSDVAHREKCCDLDGNGCIICAMARTLLQSQSSSSAIRPQIVYSKLKIICKHLVPGRQEDAHEFLRYLVEAMERAYLHRIKNWKDLEQYSKETTPLNQILGGYLRSAVRCLSCQHVSVTFQHFEDLLLDIRKANSIEEAVDMYFARERLEDTGYKCEACKKRVSATKQFSLERAPIALCVQLKRFSMMGGKLNKPISIRSRLELTQFSSNKKTDVKLEYKLVSLVTHIGASQHCGHYTAIGCTESGTYYQFDDSMVRPISVQSVLDTQAYLLFYELIDNTCLNGNGSRQNFKDIDMFSDSPKSSMIKKSYTGSMVSNGTSTTKTLNYEKKPGFIGPQMPQKNGISSTNTSQNPIKSNQQPTNSKLVNNILSGSKIGSAQNGNTSNLSNNNNGPVSPAIKKTELNGNISAHSPAKRLVNPFTANNTQNSTKKQSLPSMPRLSSSSPSNEASTSTKNVTSPVPSTSSNGKQNGFCASNTTISNNKPKSLVPDYSDESDSEIGTDRGHDIVKTKTGPWKVIENDCSDRPSLQGSTDNTIRPVSAPSTPTSTHSNSNDSTLEPPSSNQQKVYRSVSENGTDAVGHLLKQSHRGYGNSNVQTWNGDKSIIDKEIMQERRDERKRQYQEDRETDMDRGRIKKIKTYRDDDRQKTSRNYFQFAQNRENSHVNRAKWLSNNQTRAFQNNKGSSMSSFSQRASHFTPRSFNNNNNHHSHHYRNSYSGHGKNHQKRWNQQQYSGGGGNRYHNGNNSNHNRERRS